MRKISRSELRFDIGEIISNLSRTMSNLNIHEANSKEIEEEIDAALLGERSSITKIDLSEGKRRQVKDIILKKLRQMNIE